MKPALALVLGSGLLSGCGIGANPSPDDAVRQAQTFCGGAGVQEISPFAKVFGKTRGVAIICRDGRAEAYSP